ncbi:MAG: DUF1616 domain-containing protein [Chloroflexi bacterium]|nr:DUF1616 domain-containing protein [Chloroflexota bacterium]
MQVKRNGSLYPTITLDCLICSAPAAVLAGYIILAGLIALNVQSPLRVGLAVILAVFGSGSSTVAALFPRPGSLDFVERTALSACLSLAIGGILGFALARSLWGLRLQPLLIATGIYNLICWGITWLRRRRLSREERIILLHTSKLFPPRTPGAANHIITVVLVVCLAAGIWVFARSLNQPALDTPMTEFYLLGPGGQTADYPQTGRPGETLAVTCGIANRENQAAAYQIRAFIEGEEIGSSQMMNLASAETLTNPLTLRIPAAASGKTRVEFVLYLNGDPYRYCHLWLDISS